MTEAYDTLKQRIEAKRLSIAQQEEVMKAQMDDITSHLTPSNMIKGAINKVVGNKTASAVIQTGLGLGISFLADRLIFRKRNLLIRSVGMFAVRKLVNKFTNR